MEFSPLRAYKIKYFGFDITSIVQDFFQPFQSVKILNHSQNQMELGTKSHIFNALEKTGIFASFFFFFFIRINSIKVEIKKLELVQENTMLLVNANKASYLL